MSTRLFGLDIGGTKIGICLGDSEGRILASDRIVTRPDADPAVLLEAALEGLRGLGSGAQAIGMACPGPLSYERGCLLEVPNMPRWHGFPIVDFVSERMALPVRMMNDANASVLAEAYWGAARGVRSAVFLTMSTGMGAGLLLDGRVYEGPLGLAGEIGHIRLSEEGPVGFAKRGSVEGFLSGRGILQVAQAERLICEQAGEATGLTEGALTVERVCQLAAAGDAAAARVTERVGARLGQLCALLVDLLNPEVIVVGTIGAAWPQLFLPAARRVLAREAIAASAALVRLEPSPLSDRGNQTAIAIARYDRAG